jgi:hypothetical protein
MLDFVNDEMVCILISIKRYTDRFETARVAMLCFSMLQYYINRQ